MKNLQDSIIRPSEIQGLYGISLSDALRQINANVFPDSFKATNGCKVWFKKDLDKHFKKSSKAKNVKKCQKI